jgi:hypothetical protein
MEIVDPLTPEILRILHTKLSKAIKECIERVRTLKADKGKDSTVAVQRIATTTPPRCLVDTLIICRDEISHRQQSVEIAKQLDATLSSSHPEGRELARFQAQRLTSSPTYLGKLQPGVEDKLKKWRPRGYTIKLLPPLTREDVRSVEQMLNEDEEKSIEGDAEEEGPVQQSRSRTLRHTLRLYVRNNIDVPMCHAGWRELTTGPLLGSAPARFGAPNWQPPANPIIDEILERGENYASDQSIQLQQIADVRRWETAQRRQNDTETIKDLEDYIAKVFAQ